MKNIDIRNEIVAAGLRLWQVAEGLGISDCNFSRMLRYDLTEEKKARIRSVISDLQERGALGG